MKSVFARHGVPTFLVIDNGPQYTSREMQLFAQQYNYKQVTSSLHHPQSNGLAEQTVMTVKGLLVKSEDFHQALLAYRATLLLWCGYSPAQLLMGRCLRTDVSQIPGTLTPDWSHLPEFRTQERRYKEKQKEDYDRRHKVKAQLDLDNGRLVWVRTDNDQQIGWVLTAAHTPRSYLVQTSSGTVHRNQSHLICQPERLDEDSHDEEREPKRTIMTQSQTGTIIYPPQRLAYLRRGDVV